MLHMGLNLVRSITFNCAHLYAVKEWTKDQNLKEFGLCFSPLGHGHTYRFEAYVTGPIDPVTGMIINLRDLDLALKDVTSALNNKHLNVEVPAFTDTQPTTENIAVHLTESLKTRLKTWPVTLSKTRLYETDSLWVECDNL